MIKIKKKNILFQFIVKYEREHNIFLLQEIPHALYFFVLVYWLRGEFFGNFIKPNQIN